MKAIFLRSSLFAACFIVGASAADEPSAPKPATEEMIRARLLEHTRTKEAAKSASVAPKVETAAPITAPSPTPGTAKPDATAASKAPADPAAVMPKVEVNKSRITILDHQLQEQDKLIKREKQNTKPTELDRALNNPKVSIPLFGGESTKYRNTVASERVSLMESEKDVMEAIAHAKTKEEKAELKKELAELKALRRDLEKALR